MASPTEPRVAAALRTTFFISFAAAVIDLFFGLIVAWVLTRYEFPGRRLLDAFVDLALRAADGGRRHFARRALCAERLVRRRRSPIST